MSRIAANHWLRHQPIAHRGLHALENGVPENSLKAFERAIAANYAIALDLQVTHDQNVIVFHDDDLKRACGMLIKVADKTYEGLRNYRLFKTSEHIPTLREVLSLVNGRVPLLIGIRKQRGIRNANMIVQNCLIDYKGAFAIQSFDPCILSWFSHNVPLTLRGRLVSDLRQEEMAGYKKWLFLGLRLNRFSKSDFISYDFRALPSKMVDKQRQGGKPVLVWTISSESERVLAQRYSDNIIFEGFEA